MDLEKEQKQTFQKSKQLLLSSQTLAHFDLKLEIVLYSMQCLSIWHRGSVVTSLT